MKMEVLVAMKKGTFREMMPMTASSGAACISYTSSRNLARFLSTADFDGGVLVTVVLICRPPAKSVSHT